MVLVLTLALTGENLTGESLPGALSTDTTKSSLLAATNRVTFGALGHGMDIAILHGITKPGQKSPFQTVLDFENPNVTNHSGKMTAVF